jgi:hypothetical protein
MASLLLYGLNLDEHTHLENKIDDLKGIAIQKGNDLDFSLTDEDMFYKKEDITDAVLLDFIGLYIHNIYIYRNIYQYI